MSGEESRRRGRWGEDLAAVFLERKGYRIVGGLEETDRIMADTFWVGVYPGMTDEKIDYMAKIIKEGLSR